MEYNGWFDIESDPGLLPQNMDQYLAESEARYPDIIRGAEKKIVWHDVHQKKRTRLALVYLHGFSACRQEIRPVCEKVARCLAANLFLTRLTGHGRGARAMAKVSLADWLHDAAEALMIGRRLGERVVLVGTSTGATLATWLVDQDKRRSVSGCVLLSPNFGVKHAAAGLLTWPGARYWLPLVMGHTRSWEALNPLHAKYWSIRYPLTALIPMMLAVRMVKKIDFEKITLPMLFVYSPHDQVVSAREIEKIYRAIGSKAKQRLLIQTSQHSLQHIIAGDILSPDNNERVVDGITSYLESALPDKD